jgi:anti-anti-sigma factor
VTSHEVVRWTRSPGFAIAHLTGDLDLVTAASTFAAIVHGRSEDVLVIDFTGVDFMDSTALGHLVQFGDDEDVRVVAPEGTGPRRVLEITKLTTRFATFETVEAAIAPAG